jgi:hypothetical protein
VVENIISLHKSIIDRLGIGLSLLCLAHCLSIPLLYLFFPIIDNNHFSEELHVVLGLVVIGLAIPAFWKGFRAHSKKIPALFGASGCSLLLMAFIVPETETHLHTLHIDSHITLTILGSILLIIGHILNIRSCSCGSSTCQSEKKKAGTTLVHISHPASNAI